MAYEVGLVKLPGFDMALINSSISKLAIITTIIITMMDPSSDVTLNIECREGTNRIVNWSAMVSNTAHQIAALRNVRLEKSE